MFIILLEIGFGVPVSTGISIIGIITFVKNSPDDIVFHFHNELSSVP